MRELVQGHSSNGSAEDEEPEAEHDEEPEAEADDEQAEADDEPEAIADDEPDAMADDEPEAEADDEPEAMADDEPDAEPDERAEGEAEGGRPGRPRHPLFEQALAPRSRPASRLGVAEGRQTERATDSAAATARRPRTPAQRA